jgi:hypothetical protein
VSNPNAGEGRAARRPPLLLQWVGPPPSPEQPFGILRLASGREANAYFLEPLAGDFGRAFSLTKLTEAGEQLVYHVLIDGRGSSCDSPGFQRYSYCKHWTPCDSCWGTANCTAPPIGPRGARQGRE